MCLATCYELGIREVYPIGGAQAVSAMAFGYRGLPRVDQIVGPGNLLWRWQRKLCTPRRYRFHRRPKRSGGDC